MNRRVLFLTVFLVVGVLAMCREGIGEELFEWKFEKEDGGTAHYSPETQARLDKQKSQYVVEDPLADIEFGLDENGRITMEKKKKAPPQQIIVENHITIEVHTVHPPPQQIHSTLNIYPHNPNSTILELYPVEQGIRYLRPPDKPANEY